MQTLLERRPRIGLGPYLNPFPTKDVYIRPMFCHTTTDNLYKRPQIKNITERPVVRNALNKISRVAEKGLALF